MASLGTDNNDRLERALGDAMMGNLDRAYAVLRGGAWKEGSISVIQSVMNLRANPMLAQFRADSRYAGFLRELGLEP